MELDNGTAIRFRVAGLYRAGNQPTVLSPNKPTDRLAARAEDTPRDVDGFALLYPRDVATEDSGRLDRSSPEFVHPTHDRRPAFPHELLSGCPDRIERSLKEILRRLWSD